MLKRTFETQFVGYCFLAAALMLWCGWMLLPHHIGPFFEAGDFGAIYERVWFWIWMFRIHIFGLLMTVAGFFALAALLSFPPVRVVTWPACGVAAAGALFTTLAQAFYYHHGARGSGATHGKSELEVQRFLAELVVDTEFTLCLIQLGRLFGGFGLVALGIALVVWKVVPAWLGAAATVLGLIGMVITLFWTGDYGAYAPVFHTQVVWFGVFGLWLVLRGAQLGDSGR